MHIFALLTRLKQICDHPALVDGGDIVMQEAIPIGERDTAAAVYERVCDATLRVVLREADQVTGRVVDAEGPAGVDGQAVGDAPAILQIKRIAVALDVGEGAAAALQMRYHLDSLATVTM